MSHMASKQPLKTASKGSSKIISDELHSASFRSGNIFIGPLQYVEEQPYFDPKECAVVTRSCMFELVKAVKLADAFFSDKANGQEKKLNMLIWRPQFPPSQTQRAFYYRKKDDDKTCTFSLRWCSCPEDLGRYLANQPDGPGNKARGDPLPTNEFGLYELKKGVDLGPREVSRLKKHLFQLMKGCLSINPKDFDLLMLF